MIYINKVIMLMGVYMTIFKDTIYLLVILFMTLVVIIFILVKRIHRCKKELTVMTSLKDTIYDMEEKVSKTDNLETVYKIILNTAIDIIPSAEKGTVLLLEEDGKFHFKSQLGFSEDLKGMTLEKQEAYLCGLNNFSETAIIDDPFKYDTNIIDENKMKEMHEVNAFTISCTISSPIWIEGKLIGLINVDSTKKREGFHKEDVKLMNYIKNELQLVLKNSFIQDRLRYMANYDELTGLYSRRYFRSLFAAEINYIKRYMNTCTLALIDLDDFKNINDTLGHGQGDKALKLFARVLTENIRNTDIYARMSGDEFVILFKNANKKDVDIKIHTLRSILSKKDISGMKIDFSYGLCEINAKDSLSEDEILKIADIEMYKDKKNKGVR